MVGGLILLGTLALAVGTQAQERKPPAKAGTTPPAAEPAGGSPRPVADSPASPETAAG